MFVLKTQELERLKRSGWNEKEESNMPSSYKMRKPRVKNKYNLTISKIKKLKIKDRSQVCEPLFCRNNVISARNSTAGRRCEVFSLLKLWL